MKYTTSERTPARDTARAPQQDAGGADAVSRVPPAYGIDFVDGGPGAATLQRRAAASGWGGGAPGSVRAAPHLPAIIQRVSNEEVATARAGLRAESATSIERYVPRWKKRSNTDKRQIFTEVAAREDEWYDARDHVMAGSAATPPTGYHSKALGATANAEGTGARNPATARKAPYKQWVKHRGQAGNANLKISTFFPDSWDETKIRANVLLSFTSAGFQMSDQLAVNSLGGATWFPARDIDNPAQPT